MNLDRRTDRAQAQQNALRRASLDSIAERVPAVDGRGLDLHAISEDILTPAGRDEALVDRPLVLGRLLTPGGIGLWMTWHGVLRRIEEEAKPHQCYLVVEDDADYVEGFVQRLQEVMAALDVRDQEWSCCVVGYIRSKSRLLPLFGVRASDSSDTLLDTPMGLPRQLCGATAVLVRGAAGAKAMREALFPVKPGSQFDLNLGYKERICFMSAVPLASAPLSEAGDTDIQVIPEDKKEPYRLEARIRQQLGDSVLAVRPELADMLGNASFSDELVGFLRSMGLDTSGIDDAPAGVGPLKPEHMREAAKGIGAYAVAKQNGYVMARVQESTLTKWSLSGPFSLVGSWDDWKAMHPMRALPDGDGFCITLPLSAGTAKVEFQITFDGDWSRRFCPESQAPFSAPIGPVDLHGWNFSTSVPSGSRCFRVFWDPSGMRRLGVDFE